MLPLLQLFYITALRVRFCRHIPDSCRKLIKLCIPSPSYVCPYTGSSESSASCSPCLIHTVCFSRLVSGPEKSSASFSSGSPKEGIRQKNIHAARNTRRTAVPFPTVLFMDFIIGIHNSMLNCGPYHTVCNIKKQRDHTGPDGQCHKDSKQSSNHIHMHFLLQYIIFVWYISIIACFYILLPYFFITKRQRITFLPLP